MAALDLINLFGNKCIELSIKVINLLIKSFIILKYCTGQYLSDNK